MIALIITIMKGIMGLLMDSTLQIVKAVYLDLSAFVRYICWLLPTPDFVTLALLPLMVWLLPNYMLKNSRLVSDNSRLTLENQRLKSENASTKQENERLKVPKFEHYRSPSYGPSAYPGLREVAALKQENAQLRISILNSTTNKIEESNGQLSRISAGGPENGLQMKVQVPRVGSQKEALIGTILMKVEDVKKIKDKLQLQKPLVQCAMRIRRRLYEQSRERLGLGRADHSAVLLGNTAAHHGDVVLDTAIIALLKLEPHGFNEQQCETTAQDFERVFVKLYQRLYTGELDASMLLYVEQFNIVGTIIGLSSDRNRVSNHYDDDVEEIKELQGEFRAQRNYLQHIAPEAWPELMDSNPVLNRIVCEMRHIKLDCMNRR